MALSHSKVSYTQLWPLINSDLQGDLYSVIPPVYHLLIDY